LLLTVIKYTPLSENDIIVFINNFAPDAFKETFISIVSDVYADTNIYYILIYGVALLWVAGKGFVSLIEGLNSVFDIKEHRNDFVLRLVAIVYTLFFVLIIVICMAIFIFAGKLFSTLYTYAPWLSNIFDWFMQFRNFLAVGLFTIVFTILYAAIPHKKIKMRMQIPGALFSAIGWIGFSYFFSLYVNYSKSASFIYGSLTTAVCIMLWLYVCMFIFLMGAEINFYIEQWRIGNRVTHAEKVKAKKEKRAAKKKINGANITEVVETAPEKDETQK